jgi:hypothetical protein
VQEVFQAKATNCKARFYSLFNLNIIYMSKSTKENTSIFGHTHVFTGYQGSVPYLKPKKGAVDNTGDIM